MRKKNEKKKKVIRVQQHFATLIFHSVLFLLFFFRESFLNHPSQIYFHYSKEVVKQINKITH